MSKHSPLSLLERAAEIYDFRSALRARAPEVQPEPAPFEPAPAQARIPQPVHRVRPAAPARARGAVAAIDRAALAEAGYVVPGGPVTGLAEEFRLIKHQLLARMDARTGLSEEKRRSVLICSSQAHEGKTFCAVNLALSLACEREVEILLVDGDFPKPEALARLGIPTGPGLVDALADPNADPEDFIIRTDLAGLSVLPAGRKANNVPELLASDRFPGLLARLVGGDGRRIILFDSPPALMASPATVLAGHVGQALVVVRADETTEADLRETVSLLSGCDQVSLILNAAGLAVTGRKFGSYDGYGDED